MFNEISLILGNISLTTNNYHKFRYMWPYKKYWQIIVSLTKIFFKNCWTKIAKPHPHLGGLLSNFTTFWIQFLTQEIALETNEWKQQQLFLLNRTTTILRKKYFLDDVNNVAAAAATASAASADDEQDQSEVHDGAPDDNDDDDEVLFADDVI